MVFIAGSGQIAMGLGLLAPDPGDDTSGGNYWYVVSRTPYVTITSTESKAYFNNNNNHSITIEHANICPSGSDENAGAAGGGTTHTLYQVLRRDGTVVASGWGRHDFSGACGSLTFNVSGGDFQPVTTFEGTKYPFTIRATHQGAGNTQNGFKVRLDGGGVVGMKANGSRDSGIQRGGANVYDNINIPTRTPCDVSSAIWSSINIFDPDNGVAGVQPERFRVRVLHNGNPLPASRYNPGSRWSGNATDGYMPGNQSNEDYSLGVRWLPNERYVIQLRHVYGNNTLQVGIPFDSAPYDLECRNEPTGQILSVDCTASAGQRIRITSNDRDGSTQARILVGPSGSPNWTSSWVANGTQTINVPANSGGMNFTSGRWRIELFVRDKLSNGTFAAGSIEVDAAQTERCDPPVVYERFVTLRPIVDQPPGIGIEPTESVRFNGRVNVSGFPTTSQWGYTQFATQNANNSGITANRETYSNQQGAQDGGASGNVAFARLCRDGAYRTTCGDYRCQNGSYGNTCGNYYWQCSWNGKTKYPGWSGSQPACNIFGYYCRDSNGNWKTDPNYEYRDFSNREDPNGCNNRWNCPAPSGTPNAYGPDSSVAPCLIYNCVNGADPQNFYESNGNGGGAADRHCDFRCSSGTGNHAPLATAGANNKYGDGDLRCYRQPNFRMECRWDDPTIPVQVVNVTSDGNYCPSFNDETGEEIGLSVCAAYSVRDPLNTGNWNPGSTTPWPGYGQDGSGNWRQLRDWGWVVGPQDEKCMRVVGKPTVKVNGGDIAVGGRFANACSINPTNSSIVGWPHSPVFDASGTQYGAFAASEIFGFSSATIRSNAQTQPASGLAFANTVASGDRYGGSFGPMPCIADHAGAEPATATTTGSLNNPTLDGSYRYMSTVINGTPTIQAGRQVVVYVDGDLRIESNILYRRDVPWPTPSDIPALKVVVKGNIYIDPSVTELNGIYVAQPNAAGVGGNIYTCSSGFAPVAGVNMYTSCPNQLTVNGAFVAGQIHFGRTTGTAIFGDTAEEFNYLPEVWLAQWPRDNTATNVKYDAMTNLPPVL